MNNNLRWRRGGVKPNGASIDGEGEPARPKPPPTIDVNPPDVLKLPDAAGDSAAPADPVAAPAPPSRWARLGSLLRKLLPSRAWLRGFAVGLTIAYATALLILVLALRFIGEGWWVTTTLLYLPRLLFALPLPVIAAGLLLFGSWRQILSLLPVPIVLLLFPLMGLHLGAGSLLKPARAAEAGKLRVLTFNIAAGDYAEAAVATILAAKADIILMQEWDSRVAVRLEPQLPHFHRSVNHQFGILSRHPIVDVYLPSQVPYLEANDHAARYARYRIQTPGGLITVLNVHPVSPRKGFERFRRLDVPGLLKKGVGGDEGVAFLRRNAAMRWEETVAIAAEAARATGPVIIAGDTNLPALSRIYGETLAHYRDGFSAVGRGFGYTYPAHQPWMRIDRILASPSVRFLRFEVLPAGGSDHLAVTADLIVP